MPLPLILIGHISCKSSSSLKSHPHPNYFHINYNHSFNPADASSMFLQNISVNLQNYTVLKPRQIVWIDPAMKAWKTYIHYT